MFTARTLLPGKVAILILAALTVGDVPTLRRVAAFDAGGPLGAAVACSPFHFFPIPCAKRGGPRPLSGRRTARLWDRTVHEPYFLNGRRRWWRFFCQSSTCTCSARRSTARSVCEIQQRQVSRCPQHETRRGDENRVVGIVAADGLRVTVRQIAGLIRGASWAGPTRARN